MHDDEVLEVEVIEDDTTSSCSFPALISDVNPDDDIELSESEDVIEEPVDEIIAIVPRKIIITRDYIKIPEEGDGEGEGDGDSNGKGKGKGPADGNNMSEFLRKIQAAREALEGQNQGQEGDPYDDTTEGDPVDHTNNDGHTPETVNGERFNVRKKERF